MRRAVYNPCQRLPTIKALLFMMDSPIQGMDRLLSFSKAAALVPRTAEKHRNQSHLLHFE